MVKAHTTVATAAGKMRKYHVGCLVVIDDTKHVVGIVTERDVIDKVVARMTDPLTVCVSAIMTPNIISCTMQTEISKARLIMARHGVRHLPIIEDDTPLGMISSRDVMAHELSASHAVIKKQSRILSDSDQSPPGITRLQMDTWGRVIN